MRVLAEVVRSGYVESTHVGSIVAVRADGSTAMALGDLDRPLFPRSANKPMQVVGLLEAGFAPAAETGVAIAASSHSGEPGHLVAVREVLGDLGEDVLRCPPELPDGEEAAHEVLRDGGGPSRIAMNCSGKHAAMVRTSADRGFPLVDYLEVTHPVQRAVLGSIEQLAGEHVRHVAVDGCGAPQHALTLPALARAYHRLVTTDGAPRRVADAMRAHPWHVGGTGRDVTRLMEGIPGLIAKDGAEGVLAAALPNGTAVALKIADGSARARMPVLVAALRVLGVDAPVLDVLATVPVLGGGRPVGEVRAVSLA